MQITEIIFIQYPKIPTYFIPYNSKYFLVTLLSNSCDVCSSFKISDIVLQPHSTTEKNCTVLCLIFGILKGKREDYSS